MTNIVTSVTQSSGRSFKVTAENTKPFIGVSVENTKPFIGVSVSGRGPQGPQGPQGEKGKSTYDLWLEEGNIGTFDDFIYTIKQIEETFIHQQMDSSDTWTIQHNLRKYPSVTIVDSGGTVVIGDIYYISNNVIILTFVGAFSGEAYLN